MYCDKLVNIVQHTDSSKYMIDRDIIIKLDKFIKQKTTKRERTKLNPLKFSIEMKVNQETSLMSFVIGSKIYLFQTRAYYDCYCGDHFELFHLNKEYECTCGKKIIPLEVKNRIYLYFDLLEEPENCPWDVSQPESQLDFLKEGDLNFGNFTMAALDEIAGSGASENLISLEQKRTEMLKDFIERDNII
jgi:DNA-directed RNA polymerase subunit RPC12/RpoP